MTSYHKTSLFWEENFISIFDNWDILLIENQIKQMLNVTQKERTATGKPANIAVWKTSGRSLQHSENRECISMGTGETPQELPTCPLVLLAAREQPPAPGCCSALGQPLLYGHYELPYQRAANPTHVTDTIC